MPEASTLHTDAILTNLSLQYRNEQLIWPMVMPVVPVMKLSDKYYIYTKEDSYRLADDSVSPKANPNEIDWSVSTGNYSVVDHALADWIAQEEIDNADVPLNVEADTVSFLTNALQLKQSGS